MHSYAELCELIELLFGEVNGVGHSMAVLDGVHVKGSFGGRGLAPFVSVA